VRRSRRCSASPPRSPFPCSSGRRSRPSKRRDGDRLATLAAAIVALGVASAILQASRMLLAQRVSVALEADLRGRLFARLQSVELSFLDAHDTASLTSIATVDLRQVRLLVGNSMTMAIQSVLTIAAVAIVMFVYEPALAAIALAPFALLAALSARYAVGCATPTGRRAARSQRSAGRYRRTSPERP